MVGRPTKLLSSLTLVPNGPAIIWHIGVTDLVVISISTVESRLHHLQVSLVWLRDGYWPIECNHTQAADARTVAHSSSNGLGVLVLLGRVGGRTVPMRLIRSLLVLFSFFLLSPAPRRKRSSPSWSILLLVRGAGPSNVSVLLLLFVLDAWLPILGQSAAPDPLWKHGGSW